MDVGVRLGTVGSGVALDVGEGRGVSVTLGRGEGVMELTARVLSVVEDGTG